MEVCADVEGALAQALGHEERMQRQCRQRVDTLSPHCGSASFAALHSISPSQVTWGPPQAPTILVPVLEPKAAAEQLFIFPAPSDNLS